MIPADIQKKVIIIAFFAMATFNAGTAGAKPGSDVLQVAANLPSNEREPYLIDEILTENPISTAAFATVKWSEPTSGTSGTHEIVLRVASDYVATGSSSPVRIPLTPAGAQRLANNYGCVLPTTKIVDQIHGAAKHQLEPQPFSPEFYDIESTTVWKLNSDAIDAQLEKFNAETGDLISGAKKDVVITIRLGERLSPARVAVYGWHKRDGKPIQPLSLVHRADYLDYSHGIRMVSDSMQLDGVTTSVKAVLVNSDVAHLLSYEGALTSETLSY